MATLAALIAAAAPMAGAGTNVPRGYSELTLQNANEAARQFAPINARLHTPGDNQSDEIPYGTFVSVAGCKRAKLGRGQQGFSCATVWKFHDPPHLNDPENPTFREEECALVHEHLQIPLIQRLLRHKPRTAFTATVRVKGRKLWLEKVSPVADPGARRTVAC